MYDTSLIFIFQSLLFFVLQQNQNSILPLSSMIFMDSVYSCFFFCQNIFLDYINTLYLQKDQVSNKTSLKIFF
jgi:hypothetical protein